MSLRTPISTLFPYTTLFRSEAISKIVRGSRGGGFKSICFVTGVPGAGKTLVGLNTATNHHDQSEDRKSTRLNSSHMSISYAVFCLKKKRKNIILKKKTTYEM